MGLLDNFLMRFGYSKATKPAPAMLLAAADSQRWDMPEASAAEKQAKLYAALTWVATAIDTVASLGSAAEYSVMRQVGEPGEGDDEDLPNHEFELLLRRPNPMQSRGEFLRDSLSWFKTTGNLYLHLNRPNENTPPDEMWIIPSTMMRPIPDGRQFVRGYEFTAPNKEPIIVPKWEILHLKTWNPDNPFVGLSAVQSLALDAYADLAQQKWQLSFYDKNNARMPGVLAFKHMIDDPQWKRLQKIRDEEWGGARQAGVLMLRGVGDLVQYLPASATQKDMELLAARQFTKEEIYGKLAPGLSSILAVNATEANAIAGKATLIEFGVWPLLDQLSQKFTSDVLPLYGDNLTGGFDDMRQTNRILDLQEQAEAAKYFTINEMRRMYYEEAPLYLDESQKARQEEDAATQEENKEMALEQFKPAAGAKPAPNSARAGKADTSEKPTKELDPRGLMFVAQIGPTTPLPGDTSKPTPPAMPPTPPPQVPQNEQQDGQPDEDAAGEELAKWEKFAVKRLGRGGRDFEPKVLDVFTAGRIRTALKAATTAEAVRRVFAAERGGDETLRDLTAALREAAAAVKEGK
jgi:phage portal protein BeeE